MVTFKQFNLAKDMAHPASRSAVGEGLSKLLRPTWLDIRRRLMQTIATATSVYPTSIFQLWKGRIKKYLVLVNFSARGPLLPSVHLPQHVPAFPPSLCQALKHQSAYCLLSLLPFFSCLPLCTGSFILPTHLVLLESLSCCTPPPPQTTA